jgi:uncharacterized protein (DUF1330 family)
MAAFVICDITVTDPEAYETYKQLAAKAVEDHGGRYIARGGMRETLEGGWEPARLVVLEFPTMEQARRWYASAEYEEAKRARRDAASANIVVLQGI